MVDIATSLGATLLATFIPLYLGISAPRLFIKSASPERKTLTFLAATAAGITFWFFLDVMGDAALLDVNQGFQADNYSQAISHVVIALLFALGLVASFWLEQRWSRVGKVVEGNRSTSAMASFAIATLAALAVGFHSIGEGIQIGASLPHSSDILEAIGGVGPGIAYVLHKILEGFVIGVFSVLAGSVSKNKIGLLGIISGGPTVIGFILGFLWISYSIPTALDSSYFFALGAAGAIYIEVKLIPVFARTRLEYASIIPALLGFYAMYIAGLFHS